LLPGNSSKIDTHTLIKWPWWVPVVSCINWLYRGVLKLGGFFFSLLFFLVVIGLFNWQITPQTLTLCTLPNRRSACVRQFSLVVSLFFFRVCIIWESLQ
jgi:hypothetical protein